MNMFCYQCEQTAKGKGCTIQGVCGKTPNVSAYIDITIEALKGLSNYAHHLRELGIVDNNINIATTEGLFLTVTNVNFDTDRYKYFLIKLFELQEKAKELYIKTCNNKNITPKNLEANTILNINDELTKQVDNYGIQKRKKDLGDTVTGLQELLLYGIKGAAAYADHAHILGKDNDEIYAFFHQALSFLSTNPKNIDELLAMILKSGEINLKTMELLDQANTHKYGNPEPTKVRITPVKGKAILVSGHDLADLETLLKQTQGKEINIYTHGEMLSCQAYPELKKYKHLIGNYGGAWQEQQKEFSAFPGAILMTTNCLQKPQDNYKNRIFTTGLVGWPDITNIKDKNFEPVINAALEAKGFDKTEPEKFITIGFGHNTIINVSDKIIEQVKQGNIKHFFLIGGCDGAKPGRNYYTELAEKIPKDCIILTLACGKYRFNKKDFGEINGIPRLIDIGQCNDAYSAIQIAIALSKAFNCTVNELPLSLILSWYEQKAVAILLSLLYLGIKNIRLGPSLPAFITQDVLNILVEKFNIMPISTPEKDLAAIMNI